MSLDAFFDHFGSLRFWLDATILTGLVSFVWSMMRRLAELALFRLALRTREIEVSFKSLPDVPDEITALKCLMIRYGNDTYLRDLGSDMERHHGRLRNRVFRVRGEDCDDASKRFVLRLKVHRRLGTQFKFFVDVEGDPARVMAYLEAHETVYDVSASPRPGHRKRVFFLVRDFPTITTVDGFENNMIWPV